MSGGFVAGTSRAALAPGAPLQDGVEYSIAVIAIRVSEVRYRAFDDVVLADLREMTGDIAHQPLLLCFAQQTVEIPGLYEIIVFGVKLRRVISRKPVHLH